MRGREQNEHIEQHLVSIERALDALDRRFERVEVANLVREPDTALSADAYNGLRKQVIAAVSERMAHLQQLVQFRAAVEAGASSDELALVVREWCEQSDLEVVTDTSLEGAFELVGPDGDAGRRLVRPAYIDRTTGRVIRQGIAECIPVDEGAQLQTAANGSPVEDVDIDDLRGPDLTATGGAE